MQRLSMITVCRNAEAYVEKTIKSVLHQTVPVYEYILIDGKSDDGTMDIIRSFQGEFEMRNIRYTYVSEPDEGISDAFNKGIAKATGDIVGLINADDELEKDANEILQGKCDTSTADILFGNCLWIDKKNRLTYVSQPKKKKQDEMYQLIYEMVLIHPATFIRKAAYDKYGEYSVDFKYCMDQELLYRMYVRGAAFEYVDAVLAKMTSGGVSDANPRKVLREASEIAIRAGKPVWIVRLVEQKKYIRNRAAYYLKKIKVYRGKKVKRSNRKLSKE